MHELLLEHHRLATRRVQPRAQAHHLRHQVLALAGLASGILLHGVDESLEALRRPHELVGQQLLVGGELLDTAAQLPLGKHELLMQRLRDTWVRARIEHVGEHEWWHEWHPRAGGGGRAGNG